MATTTQAAATATARDNANRANAQHSTGPRTPEGKARSAANALQHGFRSSTVLLPGDDPAEYEALLAELSDHFATEDLTEQRAVREMANAEWRLRRVREYISITLEKAFATLQADNPALPALELQALAFTGARADLAPLLKYETKFERQYDRAYRTWAQYQEIKRLEEFRRTQEVVERYQREQQEEEKAMAEKIDQLRQSQAAAAAAAPEKQKMPNEPNAPAAAPGGTPAAARPTAH